MSIITLTTDMGTRDHYLAAVKGALYSQLKEAIIVDISHQITPFDIAGCAFVLKNAYKEFPKGTVHIIGVDPELEVDKPHVIVKMQNQYFIGADNGIFSLLFDQVPESIFQIRADIVDSEHTFPVKDIFTKVACHIARGGTPEIVGNRITSLAKKQMYRAIVEEDTIRGTVIYIDSYGNVITNITRSLFFELSKERVFNIQFRSAAYSIEKISNKYSDVPEGEKLAIFGTSGNLEIAINKGVEGSGGGANKLFGIRLYDIVTIEFG